MTLRVTQILAWLHRRWQWLLAYAAIAAIVGFLANVYLVAVAGGFYDVKPGSVALVSRTFWPAAVFWFLFSAVLFGFIGAWRTMGTDAFWLGVLRVPERIVELFREHPVREGIACAAGLALTFVLIRYVPAIPIAYSTLMTAALVLLVTSLSCVSIYLAAYLSKALELAFRLARRAGPGRLPWRAVRAFVLGAALAHLLQFCIAVRPAAYVYLLVVVLSVLLYAFRKPAPAGLAVAGGGIVLAGLCLPDTPFAWADDGGFYENSTLSSWWADRGSTGVLDASTPVAPIAGTGGLVGGTIGEAGGESEPESDEDLADRLDREIFGEPRPEPGRRTIDLPLGEDPGTGSDSR
jgi:hypothetical protein